MLTETEKSEIRMQYRQAADKKKQIDILADLYACKTADVIAALGLTAAPNAPKASDTKKGYKMKSYNQSVKDDVIKAVLLEGMTQTAAAERYGINLKTASGWVVAARRERDGFVQLADEILKNPLPEKPAAIMAAPKEQIEIKPVFEQAVQELDKEIELQLRLSGVDNGVGALCKALALLKDTGLIEQPLKDDLALLRTRAEAFRAGMLYAQIQHREVT